MTSFSKPFFKSSSITFEPLETTFNFRFGGEYEIENSGLALRFGVAHFTEPLEKSGIQPGKMTYSAGAGFLFGPKVAGNISFSYHRTADLSPGDDILPQAAERETIRMALRVGVQYRY